MLSFVLRQQVSVGWSVTFLASTSTAALWPRTVIVQVRTPPGCARVAVIVVRCLPRPRPLCSSSGLTVAGAFAVASRSRRSPRARTTQLAIRSPPHADTRSHVEDSVREASAREDEEPSRDGPKPVGRAGGTYSRGGGGTGTRSETQLTNQERRCDGVWFHWHPLADSFALASSTLSVPLRRISTSQTSA
jgi:hypothetical protein